LLLDIAISVYESMYVSRGALIISSISVFYPCGRSLTVAFCLFVEFGIWFPPVLTMV